MVNGNCENVSLNGAETKAIDGFSNLPSLVNTHNVGLHICCQMHEIYILVLFEATPL